MQIAAASSLMSWAFSLLALSAFIAVWFWQRAHSYRELLSGGLFIAGFLAGFYGFMCQAACAGRSMQCTWDALHSTLQLITLNVDGDRTPGAALGFARVALPLAAAQLIFALLGERVHQWWLRVCFWIPGRARVLVLGCGQTGLRIASYYAKRIPGVSIFGLDSAPGTHRVLEFERAFQVVYAPLDREETLDFLRLAQREHIVVCTGSDVSDLELTRRIVGRLEPMLEGKRPRVTVSVESSAVPRACELDPKLKAVYGNGQLKLLNAPHAAARLLLLAFPPHILCKDRACFTAEGKNACNIVVCGDGSLVEEIVAQAVRALVYSETEAIRITVLTPNAAMRSAAFFARFPALDPKTTRANDAAHGKQLPLANIEFEESSLEQMNSLALRRAAPLHAIYAVGRNDAEVRLVTAEAIKVAALTPAADRPVVVACFEDSALKASFPALPGGSRLEEFSLVSWSDPRFGANAGIANVVSTPDELADDVAKRIAATYGKREFVAKQADDEWSKMPHHKKWWNRYAGDHALIKRDLLGLADDATSTDIEQKVAAHSKWLSRLEHRRYVCERMTDGWLLRPGVDGKNYLLNETLKPFADLDPTDKEKDDAIVQQLEGARDALLELARTTRST